MSEYRIRPFRTLEEYRACVSLQEEVWGEGFSERVSVAILKVAQRLGGIAAGAYDGEGRLAGFVFGMTGVEEGEVVHWSDMLAVRESHRGAGLGFRLKAYQRKTLLERGITTVYWTFDPLEAKNAYLNLAKLGVLVRRYEENMYGETDSPLHRGIGTDRFVALWLLASERVRERIERRAPECAGEEEVDRGEDGSPAGRGAAVEDRGAGPEGAREEDRRVGEARLVLDAEVREGLPFPAPPRLGLDPRAGNLLVSIPREIQRLKARSPEAAAQWRKATRAVFLDYLSRGWQVTELLRPGGGATPRYLLERRTTR